MFKLFGNISNVLTAPLTKYMLIAILILGGALGGATWLSYKFYGDKRVAEVENTQLTEVIAEEREETLRARESERILDESIANVREGEETLDKAAETFQERISNPTPTQPTGDVENESERVSEDCNSFLSSDDVRLLQQAHCLSDGDTSNCNL